MIITVIVMIVILGGIIYVFFTANDNSLGISEISTSIGKMIIEYSEWY